MANRLIIFITLLTICRVKASMPSETRELNVEVLDATLSVRVAGNPRSGNAMIAIHAGPGQSYHYMLDLEKLTGLAFSVVTYD
jgi:hypothetical protein